REAIDAVMVDLDQVAGGVAHVHLHDVAGQLDQVVSEGVAVKGAAPLGRPVDGLEVGNGDAEVVVAGGGEIALEQMQLRIPEGEPLHGQPEVRRGDDLGAQQVDVEVHRLLEVARVDADVVDLRAHSRTL